MGCANIVTSRGTQLALICPSVLEWYLLRENKAMNLV